MCDTCKEFSPVFEELSGKIEKKVKVGKVNIDAKEGMQIAQSLGVLDEGIPSVQMYMHKYDRTRRDVIMSGEKDPVSSKVLLKRIRKKLTHVPQETSDSFYFKN